jgi:hypothetical protein
MDVKHHVTVRVAENSIGMVYSIVEELDDDNCDGGFGGFG